MKRILLLPLLICCTTISYAQNIVPNYSFEQDDSCPTFYNISSGEYTLGCVGWGQATMGNSDYFNACDTAASSIGRQSPWEGVPYNSMGTQTAFDGIAYTGINVYSSSLPDYKEYLIASIPALSIDTVYKVTIEVSLADSCKYAADGMGVLFTTYNAYQLTEGTLNQIPQIDYTSYGIISDTVHWVTLSGTFKADSAYTHIIIGGFKNSSKINIKTFNNPTKNPHEDAYYYVDAVVVERLSSTAVINVNNAIETQLYPNPFTNYTMLLFNNAGNVSHTFSLYNMQGQLVQQINNITSDRIKIERNNLPIGLYYYRLSNECNIIANGKVVIN